MSCLTDLICSRSSRDSCFTASSSRVTLQNKSTMTVKHPHSWSNSCSLKRAEWRKLNLTIRWSMHNCNNACTVCVEKLYWWFHLQPFILMMWLPLRWHKPGIQAQWMLIFFCFFWGGQFHLSHFQAVICNWKVTSHINNFSHKAFSLPSITLAINCKHKLQLKTLPALYLLYQLFPLTYHTLQAGTNFSSPHHVSHWWMASIASFVDAPHISVQNLCNKILLQNC